MAHPDGVVSDASLDLFGDDPAGAALAVPAQGAGAAVPVGDDAHIIHAAATDCFGQFWPYRAADYIFTLTSHRDRALAFRSVPPQFQAMVGALMHRAVYQHTKGF